MPTPSDAKIKQVEHNFTYHKPKPEQQTRFVAIRETAKQLAYLILHSTPESREQSLALTKLEEAVMWANAAIARDVAGEEDTRAVT